MSDAAGSATGSPEAGGPEAGASSHQEAEEKQAEEVEVVGSADGGASHPVRTKVPAPIFDQHGAEYSVPQVTVDAIESYVVPPGFQQEGAREEFFLCSLGNYIVPSGVDRNSASFNPTFRCQLGKCRTMKGGKIIPCTKGHKSNVNKHFRNIHKLWGSNGCLLYTSPSPRDS